MMRKISKRKKRKNRKREGKILAQIRLKVTRNRNQRQTLLLFSTIS
jgi:hypothetical protein